MEFEHNTFGRRMKSMLSVDFRRMFTMRLLYIMTGICFVIPILILVMTTMMDGTVSVNPSTGEETVIEGVDNTWQAIGSVSGGGTEMSLTGMCNINMLYFLIAVFVCTFVADDFRSGYSKNLFTVRAKKTDYVISKTLAGFAAGVFMLLGYFAGAMLGGAVSGLSFDTAGVGAGEIIMCMVSKLLLSAVFVSIYLLMGVMAKQRLWLSVLLSLCVGMLLFNMVPMISPLNSTILNVLLCLAGGVLFSAGFGAVSNQVLSKT